MTNIFDQIAKAPDNSNASPVPPPTDTGTSPEQTAGTDKTVKEIAQELLRQGHIEETRKPAVFRHCITHESSVNVALEPFDLRLRLDTHRGVAWLEVDKSSISAEDEWSHPLVRKQRLTLEQSLVLALLRHAFVMHEQENGIGQSVCKVSVDDLLPQYLTYFTDSGSDNKNESNLLRLLDQLKTYGVVSEIDKNHEVAIRPLIAHLANPESLSALLQSLQTQAAETGSTTRE